jgi:hypothetical protein
METCKADHLDGCVAVGGLVEHTHVVHNVTPDGYGREARVVRAFDSLGGQRPVLVVAAAGGVILIVENTVSSRYNTHLRLISLRYRGNSVGCLPV